MEKAEKIRVLLVDDQQLFVESLRYVLESRAPDIEIVGIAADGAGAIEAVERHRPDIVLMDVRMPGMDGVQATRVIHEQHPAVRILMLSTFSRTESANSSPRSGMSSRSERMSSASSMASS